jgi:predicted enzyme related to lactoylglutathione lyase
MLDLNSIIIFSEDPKKLKEFYAKIFQKEPDWDQDGYSGFMIGKTSLTVGPHDKIKGKNSNSERILINFETKDVKEEFDRIKEVGAKIIAEPYQMEGMEGWIATFADPDGNFLQLMSPWKE